MKGRDAGTKHKLALATNLTTKCWIRPRHRTLSDQSSDFLPRSIDGCPVSPIEGPEHRAPHACAGRGVFAVECVGALVCLPNSTLKGPVEQGVEVYRQRRSLFFKKLQIVRGCDAKRNVLVYLTYSDRVVEGSPQNSTSTVPIMPWGNSAAPKCGEFLN